MQLAGKHIHHHVAFVQAQQAMVYKHAGQLVAYGAVNQRCRHRRIDATRQPQNHFLCTYLNADFFYCLGNIVAHYPIGSGLADAKHKPLQHGLALHSVRDLRVKLHSVKATFFVSHAGNRAGIVRCHQFEAGRHLGYFVTVAHPHIQQAMTFFRYGVLYAIQQAGVSACPNSRKAKLARVPCFNLATELLCHGLHAVANPQYGHTQLKHRLRGFVGCVFIDAGMATRQDNAL